MGIKDLFIKLKDIKKNKSLNDFKGQTIGIDGNVWLYKSFQLFKGCRFSGTI